MLLPLRSIRSLTREALEYVGCGRVLTSTVRVIEPLPSGIVTVPAEVIVGGMLVVIEVRTEPFENCRVFSYPAPDSFQPSRAKEEVGNGTSVGVSKAILLLRCS